MRTPRCVRVSRSVGRQGFGRETPTRCEQARPATSTLRFIETREWLRWGLLFVAAWLFAVSTARAQLPQTRLYAVFPPGGQVGTTVDVTVTRGDDLDELSKLLFSHPGITAVQKTKEANGKQEPIPNQFTVSIGSDVPAGKYEVRAVGLFGISNPRRFVVGTRPELVEAEPNNTAEEATPVELGHTVHGRISGGPDVDFFKFSGQQGQRVIIDCLARRIDSRLDGSLEIYDAAGRRLGTARNTFARDAVLDFTVPATGEYFVRLADFVYASSDDHFYRLVFRITPFVDYIIPPAGVPGTKAQYTLYGRNLPNGEATEWKVGGQPLQKQTVEIALPADESTLEPGVFLEPYAAGVDGVPFTLNTANGPANTVMLGFSSSPVTMETEPNDQPAAAQKVTVPGEYAGQFQARADVDLYQFEAKAKEVVWIEVQGQRLGYGCDPYLTLDQVIVNDKQEETLKRIASVDDEGSNLLPIVFDTIHDDPVYKFTAPADGTYRIAVRDRYGASRGSPTLLYRLTLRRESPDFRVLIVTESPTPPNQKNPQTWSVGLRQGDQFPVWVVVLRRDGFEGDVDVSVEGLPPGVTCRDISVGSNPSSGVLVFESAEDAAEWAGTVRVVGKAKITDPQAAAAVVEAEAALKSAQDAAAAAAGAVTKPAEDLAKAEEALAAARKELEAKPDDEGLKKKVADEEAKVAAGKAAHEKVVAAKAAADQKVAESQAALTAAQAARDAATNDVVRQARYGTIVWSGRQNVPGDARVTDGLELSVVAEPAPFQVKTDVHREVANHGRQILVPVKAVRRTGFDGDINLTFVGQPRNVQIENKPIKKGSDEEVYRVFVPTNAPTGTYVMYLAAQAQVSYSRNPQKAERLKAELDAADKAANEAVAQQKSTAGKRDEAVKQAAAAQETLKKATEAKTAAEKALAEAQAAEKAAAEAVTKTGDDADAKAEAEKKLADAQAATKTATEAAAAAEAARADAEAKAKAAEEAKVAAENDVKQADELVKATAAEKTAAEKRFKDAENAAKPKNINFLPTTTPIVLTIKPAPVTVSTNPANSGNLKRGDKVEVKVGIKRENGFAGPVTLTLPVPPGVTGIEAQPVTVPPDQSEGVLVVQASGEATEGQLPNLVVRAVAEFDGQAMVDQPVTIKVSK